MSGYEIYEEQRTLNIEATERRQLVRKFDAARYELEQVRSNEDIQADIERVAAAIYKRLEGV